MMMTMMRGNNDKLSIVWKVLNILVYPTAGSTVIYGHLCRKCSLTSFNHGGSDSSQKALSTHQPSTQMIQTPHYEKMQTYDNKQQHNIPKNLKTPAAALVPLATQHPTEEF